MKAAIIMNYDGTAYFNAASEGTINSVTTATTARSYFNWVISLMESFKNYCSCFIAAVAFNVSTDSILWPLESFAYAINQ